MGFICFFVVDVVAAVGSLLRSSTFNEPGSNSGAKTEAKPASLRLSALGGTLE